MGFFEGFLISLAISLVVSVASAFLRPSTPTPDSPKPATLDQFRIATAEEGRPVPVLFGRRFILGPNIIWYGDLRTEPVREKSGKSGGGK